MLVRSLQSQENGAERVTEAGDGQGVGGQRHFISQADPLLLPPELLSRKMILSKELFSAHACQGWKFLKTCLVFQAARSREVSALVSGGHAGWEEP